METASSRRTPVIMWKESGVSEAAALGAKHAGSLGENRLGLKLMNEQVARLVSLGLAFTPLPGN